MISVPEKNSQGKFEWSYTKMVLRPYTMEFLERLSNIFEINVILNRYLLQGQKKVQLA